MISQVAFETKRWLWCIISCATCKTPPKIKTIEQKSPFSSSLEFFVEAALIFRWGSRQINQHSSKLNVGSQKPTSPPQMATQGCSKNRAIPFQATGWNFKEGQAQIDGLDQHCQGFHLFSNPIVPKLPLVSSVAPLSAGFGSFFRPNHRHVNLRCLRSRWHFAAEGLLDGG